jgi:foldase protein PrsA|uniref:peptidylprolyl isomerase n=1 Tax=Siphoviridae sp. ctHip2 TaxID=2827830 RepID=A0A8S5RVT3_9CAUD|nr:MAG TPA: foldase protein PrsA [Siphoviridae sp. ctHip2]
MKMNKKIAVACATLLSIVTFAACAHKSDVLVSMKTGDITSEKFFAQIKSNPTVQTLLSNEVISTALEDKYKDKVTSDDVEKEYEKMKEQYGDQFQSALVAAGLTENTYKAQLRSTLLLDYAVKTAAEQELKDADYEEAFKSYTPTMTVKFVKTKTKDEAKTVVDELKKETAVDTLVAKYGTLSKADQKTGELTFDSTTKDVEPELLAQITPMEVNKVSEPIAITDRKTYETVYYVVKVTKKDAKKETWKDYETILKDYIINKKASDKNYAKQVVSELLKEYKVEVKDEAFKNVIEQYLNHKNTETTEATETSETTSTTEAK